MPSLKLTSEQISEKILLQYRKENANSKFPNFYRPESKHQNFVSLLFLIFINRMVSAPETCHLIHEL